MPTSREPTLWELLVTVPPDSAELAGQILIEAGAGAVEEREAEQLVVYSESPSELERIAAAARSELPEGSRLETLVSRAQSWRTDWILHLGPVEVTDRVVVQPATDGTPAPAGMQRLLIEPGLVFGVGSHPTTRLAARLLEPRAAGARVLDVGTGSGVLAMIAVLAGAEHAFGIDTDAASVRSAEHNARLNGLQSRCTFSTHPASEVSERYPLVVANIEAPVLLQLSDQLARVTGKTLILAGLLEEREAEITGAFRDRGLAVVERAALDGWCALVLERGA